MNRTITVAMRVLVILGYLVGAADAEAMDGEAAARVSLVLAGMIVAAFLFYLALRDATVALLSKKRRLRRPARVSAETRVPAGLAARGRWATTGEQVASAARSRPRSGIALDLERADVHHSMP